MAYHVKMIESLNKFEQTEAVLARIAWHKAKLAKFGIFAI